MSDMNKAMYFQYMYFFKTTPLIYIVSVASAEAVQG